MIEATENIYPKGLEEDLMASDETVFWLMTDDAKWFDLIEHSAPVNATMTFGIYDDQGLAELRYQELSKKYPEIDFHVVGLAFVRKSLEEVVSG